MGDLKPCPWCGGEAVALCVSRGWKVQCANRYGPCPVNCRTHYHTDQDAACEQWNRRSLPRHEGVVEALEVLGKLYTAAMIAADGAADEGDRAYFGSTNDLDLLREACEAYREMEHTKYRARAAIKEMGDG